MRRRLILHETKQIYLLNVFYFLLYRHQYFLLVFGSKSDTAVLTFTFRCLSSPLFSLFLPHFFSLAGHLVGFILVGRVFRKAFRILGLGERKGR